MLKRSLRLARRGRFRIRMPAGEGAGPPLYPGARRLEREPRPVPPPYGCPVGGVLPATPSGEGAQRGDVRVGELEVHREADRGHAELDHVRIAVAGDGERLVDLQVLCALAGFPGLALPEAQRELGVPGVGGHDLPAVVRERRERLRDLRDLLGSGVLGQRPTPVRVLDHDAFGRGERRAAAERLVQDLRRLGEGVQRPLELLEHGREVVPHLAERAADLLLCPVERVGDILARIVHGVRRVVERLLGGPVAQVADIGAVVGHEASGKRCRQGERRRAGGDDAETDAGARTGHGGLLHAVTSPF